MHGHPKQRGLREARHGVRRAFTLIELLVVIAIIALLVSILLPALSRAQDAARSAVCLSNLRQLSISLFQYANDARGKFPPNDNFARDENGNAGVYWYETFRIGQYLPQMRANDASTTLTETIGGGIMTCPNHPDAGRSYTMNYWASSFVDSGRPPTGARGQGFDANVDETFRMILVADAWAMFLGNSTPDSPGPFWFTSSTIGSQNMPGQRFGGGTGVTDAAIRPQSPNRIPPEVTGRGFPTSYLPYYRHPKRTDDTIEISGSSHIGYGDGHADKRRPDDLFDPETGRTTHDTLWSPIDRKIEPRL